MASPRSTLLPVGLVPMDQVRSTSGPLYHRLMECLLASLCLAPDPLASRLPSERELMRLGGVSMITVKRALHELEALGVIARRHGSGSYPLRRPSVADLLAVARPRRFAVFSEPLFISVRSLRYDLFYFLQKKLAATGTTLSLLDEENLGQVGEFDGLFSISRRLPSGLPEASRPAMVMIGPDTAISKVDSVRIDVEDTARKAAAFIAASGRRHLCFFGHASSERSIGERLLNHLESTLGAGFTVEPFFGTNDEIYRRAREWLRRHPSIRPIFFSALYLATGTLIRATEAEGRPIGPDLPLLAFGTYNAVFEDIVPVRILRVSRELMAEEALEMMLLRLMAPGIPFQARLIPVEGVGPD